LEVSFIIITFMSEKKPDLEAIARSLAHIVSSLNGLLNNSSNVNHLQPESVRIKKTPEMTYH